MEEIKGLRPSDITEGDIIEYAYSSRIRCYVKVMGKAMMHDDNSMEIQDGYYVIFQDDHLVYGPSPTKGMYFPCKDMARTDDMNPVKKCYINYIIDVYTDRTYYVLKDKQEK